MKSYKILIFIALIITTLGVICFFFPAEGIPIGNITLRFPSIEKILVRNQEPTRDLEKELQEKEIAIKDSTLKSLMDSVNFYQNIARTHITRFYFPNDDINYFNDLFAKMEKAKGNKEVIRILHYGDSQIELDRISSNLRKFFQDKFGGGGPGLLPIVKAVPTMSYSQYNSENFITYTTYGEGARNSDGDYGILAKSFQLNGTGTFSLTAMKNEDAGNMRQYNHIRLLLNDKDGNFKAMLRDKTNKKDFEQSSTTKGLQILEWQLDTATSSFNLTMTGNARLYGVMADYGYGVSVDNVPMRGCSGTIFTKIKDSVLIKSYEMMNVGLIVMQYGGNSMPGMTAKGVNAYAERIGAQIRYLKRMCPKAKILFIGPSDMSTMVNGNLQTYPHLPETVEALKKVTTENGAAFWDMYEVMGGENSMLSWVKSGWAGNDYVHFTTIGANKIGGLLVGSFSQIYDLFKMERDAKILSTNDNWQIQK